MKKEREKWREIDRGQQKVPLRPLGNTETEDGSDQLTLKKNSSFHFGSNVFRSKEITERDDNVFKCYEVRT